ncbi:MAG: spore maturation protein [Clostridiales bacterium]|nr:spore maturation protein [Clostridiales bacterium]
MNKIFSFIFILSISIMLFTSPNNILNVIFSATEKAVTLSISLISIYAFWLGILEICEKTGLNKKLANFLSPIIDKFFDKPNLETKKQIAINISSNMLGMGNAATPSGIKGMQGLDPGNGNITKAMILFMLLNTSSIQIFPTTIIGLRITHLSTNATSIVLPTIFASILSTSLGILLLFLIEKLKKKGKKK